MKLELEEAKAVGERKTSKIQRGVDEICQMERLTGEMVRFRYFQKIQWLWLPFWWWWSCFQGLHQRERERDFFYVLHLIIFTAPLTYIILIIVIHIAGFGGAGLEGREGNGMRHLGFVFKGRTGVEGNQGFFNLMIIL